MSLSTTSESFRKTTYSTGTHHHIFTPNSLLMDLVMTSTAQRSAVGSPMAMDVARVFFFFYFHFIACFSRFSSYFWSTNHSDTENLGHIKFFGHLEPFDF